MADYYPRDDTSRRSQRRTRERQRSPEGPRPSYPFSTYSASNSSGGTSRQYGSSDYSRERRSSASSTTYSRSDSRSQDSFPRYYQHYPSSSNNKESTSDKALNRLLSMAVPVLEGVLAKAGVQQGDIWAYIDAFQHPPMPATKSRGYATRVEDIDITDRLQAVGKLVFKNHQKDIQKLIFAAIISKVKI